MRIHKLHKDKWSGYVGIDDPDGSGKYKIDDLFESIAGVAKVGVSQYFERGSAYWFKGKLYLCNESYTGVFDETKFERTSCSQLFLPNTDVQDAVNEWLDEHPEATTTVEDNSLTCEKLVIGTLNFVTPEMYGAKGDGDTDDSDAIIEMLKDGNASCLFKAGATYKVTKAIPYFSNTFIDFNGSTIRSYFNGNVFVEQAAVDNRQSNIAFVNGTIYGNGENGNVGDIGAGILGWRVDNIYVRNMRFSHTWGDGMLFRDCENVKIENCTCERFGRNGISPISGSFEIDNLVIGNTKLTGANPGLPFDCEPESGETCKLIVRDSNISGVVIVGFYVDDDDDFPIEAVFENCVLGEYYPSLWITSMSHRTIAKNVKILNTKISAQPGSSGVWLQNVSGVLIENCYFDSSNSGAANTHCIGPHDSDLLDVTIRNCLAASWGAGNAHIFAYNKTINGLTIDGFNCDIYCKDIKNSKIKGSKISYCTITNGTDSTNNVVFDSEVAEALKNVSVFGNSRGESLGSTFVSKSFEYSDSTSDPIVVKIPLPNFSARGRCFLVSVGYSHRGYSTNSGHVLASVFCGGTGDSRESINVISSVGDKTVSLASDPDAVGIIATFDTNFIGTISYSIFG